MSEGLRFAEWKQPSQAASWAEHEKTARRQSAAGSRLRLFWQNTKSKTYVTHQVDSVFVFYVFVFYRCQIKKENSSGMKSARASDTPRQEQKQSTVVLKSRYEIMIVTTENPWQLPGPIWSFFFFFSTERTFCDRSLMPRDLFVQQVFNVRPSFPPSWSGYIWMSFLNTSKQRLKTSNQNLTGKAAARVLLEQSNPKDEGTNCRCRRAWGPRKQGNSGGVNYLARRASPCCSLRRARLQMLRHLRRAVEEPLAARPRCSSDDSAQAHVVGSARGSQLSCKKVFVEKERKNIWLILKELELILWILFWIDRKEEGPRRIANKQL